jgi:putative two-component system response regulator
MATNAIRDDDMTMVVQPKGRILVVDDTATNRDLLMMMLGDHGYLVDAVSSGSRAVEAARRSPPDLVLLDINMPEADGYTTCGWLREEAGCGDTPVLFISAMTDSEEKVRAFTAGGVDYITKPFQLEEVLARVNTHLTMSRMRGQLERHNHNLQDLVNEQVAEIARSHMSTIFAMSKLAESRDDDTGKHLERVQIYARALAVKLAGNPKFAAKIDSLFIDNTYHATPLHDIGKVAIPDAILCKPGKLTDEEFAIMKTHTLRGFETLQSVAEHHQRNSFITMGIGIARSHHERWDGRGYPDGIAGEDIPLPARIMSVADVYDALTSERCYKPAFPHAKSAGIILEGRGTQFDPDVVDAFDAVQEDFLRTRQEMNE